MRRVLLSVLAFSIPAFPQAIKPPKPPQRQTTPPPTPPDIQARRDSTPPEALAWLKACHEFGETLKQRLSLNPNQSYTPQEYAAYQAASSETNREQKIKKLSEFVWKFPQSALLPYINQVYRETCSEPVSPPQPGQRTEQIQERDANPLSAPTQSQSQTLTIPVGPGTPCIASALDPSVQADAAKKMVIGFNTSPGVSPKDFAFTACVVEKLLRNRFTVPTFRWFISYVSEANAIAHAQRNEIVIYSGLLTFVNYNEDEFAAVIAHEIGHLLDYRTPAVAGQPKCIEGTRVSVWEHQSCEARADDFGLQYLLGAGYSGYGMAGFFGRVLVHQGDTGLKGFILRFTNSHPINIERLKAVRARWIELCQQRSLACQNTGQ